jgi:murein DD-endopeptidase MepM/ murein hydrolase activator NlpD
VSVRVTRWVAVGVTTGALLTGSLGLHYARIATEVRQLRQIKAENDAILSRQKEYESSRQRLHAKVQNLQSIVNKLGVMAGLEQALPDAQVGGVGGGSGVESQAPTFSISNMDANLSSLTEKSTKLEQFYKDQSILLALTPSVWPVHGYLSAGFGNRIDPFTGQRDFHPGIDVSAPIGTRVLAPADGIVISTAAKGGYGNALVLNHQYGVVTRYGHLSSYNVRLGQRVRRGDVIAFVGSTGRSTAPHLHYEVWVRDQAQNPIHFILDEYRTFG